MSSEKELEVKVVLTLMLSSTSVIEKLICVVVSLVPSEAVTVKLY